MAAGYTAKPLPQRACKGCGKIRTGSRSDAVPAALCRSCGNKASGAKRTRSLADRFWEKVNKDGPVPPHRPELGPCWLWTASVDVSGYGQLEVQELGMPTHASRVAFFLAEGRWPEPQALHHCDNPPCVKAVADELGPAHIFEGTQACNVADMHAKGRGFVPTSHNTGKTHCKHGHEFTETNTRMHGGRRECIACIRDGDNRRYRLKKETRALVFVLVDPER